MRHRGRERVYVLYEHRVVSGVSEASAMTCAPSDGQIHDRLGGFLRTQGRGENAGRHRPCECRDLLCAGRQQSCRETACQHQLGERTLRALQLGFDLTDLAGI